ncbi:DUF2059 domain-containing protein [Hankyongella ginsenosidimutans]|uniref:DUF2059 domain-containing protein n=1 Tax=Hankyongella ginsenosidimutans TaxID=1763828 RepID=UPI003CCC486A
MTEFYRTPLGAKMIGYMQGAMGADALEGAKLGQEAARGHAARPRAAARSRAFEPTRLVGNDRWPSPTPLLPDTANPRYGCRTTRSRRSKRLHAQSLGRKRMCACSAAGWTLRAVAVTSTC